MNYMELKRAFQSHNDSDQSTPLTAHVILTEDSYEREYPLLSRTYIFSSDNKAFRSGMGGYSIFASCLDGTDPCIRLDYYLADEGSKDGWRVQDCYILEQMRDAAAVANMTRVEQADGAVCYFFGNTCIRVYEVTVYEAAERGCIRLEPVSGDQVACGEWTSLSMDRVYGYCTLITRQLKAETSQAEEKSFI